MTLKIKKAALVYQAGIANVFEVDCFNTSNFGRNAKRLLQYDFRSCESFARGLACAGTVVMTFSCNRAGDIHENDWTEGLEDCPFRKSARPVNANTIGNIEHDD